MPPKSAPTSTNISPETKAAADKGKQPVGNTPPLLPTTTAWKTDATEFKPNWLRKVHHIRYTPQQLQTMRKAALAPGMENLVDHGPFQQIPSSLIPYLKLKNFQEFLELDYEADGEPSNHIRPSKNSKKTGNAANNGGSKRTSPTNQNRSPPGPQPGNEGRVSPTNNFNLLNYTERPQQAHDLYNPTNEPATDYYCVKCASEHVPCEAVKEIVSSVKSREHKNILGTFLMQSPEVIANSLLLIQVFEGKRTSMKLRNLKEKCPKVMGLVKSYLCGEGFHIAPPAIIAHEKWTALLDRLKFDWIRDNKTRIFTELSRNWKRSHSPFEQFMHFYFFRRAEPFHKTKGMLTHKQKPVIIAVLSGDLDAFILLCELGFECPSDLLWDRLPYFRESLDPKMYCVMRHLCVHYYRIQLNAQ